MSYAEEPKVLNEIAEIDEKNFMSRELNRAILALLERKRCQYTSGELQANPSLASNVINATIGKSEILESLNRDRSNADKIQKSTVYAGIERLLQSREVEPYFFRADGETAMSEDDLVGAKNFRVRIGVYDPGGQHWAEKLAKVRIEPLCTFGMGGVWQTSLPDSRGVEGIAFVFDGGNELVSLSLTSAIAKASAEPISIFFSQRVSAEEFSSRWNFTFRPDDWKQFGERVTAFHVGRTDLYQMRWNIKSGPDQFVRGPAVGHIALTLYPSGKYVLTCLGPMNSVGFVTLSDPEYRELLNFKSWARFGATWPTPPHSDVEFLSEFPKISLNLKDREKLIPSNLTSKIDLAANSNPKLFNYQTWQSSIWSQGTTSQRFHVGEWISYLEKNSVILSGATLVRINAWYFLVKTPNK